MKASTAKRSKTPETPVFQEMLHHVRTRGKKSETNPKPEKRENVFSKSRDVREDRGTRQIKTKHNLTNTFPHLR